MVSPKKSIAFFKKQVISITFFKVYAKKRRKAQKSYEKLKKKAKKLLTNY